MDLGCLIGLCAAAAQTVPSAEASGAAAAAASAASAPASSAAGLSETVASVMLFSVVSVFMAHLLTGWVVRRYERRIEVLMRATSGKVFGGGVPRARPWSADELLDGIASRRHAMAWLLVGIVAVYAVLGSWVMAAHDEARSTSTAGGLQIATSLLLFSSIAAPVVLLGLSAAQFDRIFWRWFAPPMFLAIAMQGALGYGERAPAVGAGPGADAAPRGGALMLELLPAYGALLVLMALVVLLTRRLPRALPATWRGWLRANPRRSGLIQVVLIVIAFLAVCIALAVFESAILDRFVMGTLLGGFAIGVVWYALVDRVRRIVAPLLAIGLFALFAALWAGSWVVKHGLPALGLSDGGVAGGFAVLLIALLVANFVLSWVGVAYEQKVFSDAQFQVFCWMLSAGALALIVVGLLVPDSARTDMTRISVLLAASTLVALAGYWIVMRYAFRPLLSGKRLMVLRVFSAERRGERLLDELEERWRTIGPIMLIGGTDVAKRTIDPAKAANFVRRRLADICVPNRFMLDKRIAAMDELPDPDGRYRVNEFLCTDDLWQEAVGQLLDRADAIVLDLSEFTAERRGTAWELGLLKARGALGRTVFLISAQTDQAALRTALGLHDPAAPLSAGTVIEVDRPVDGRRLVEALVHRMSPVPAAPPPVVVASAEAAATAGR